MSEPYEYGGIIESNSNKVSLRHKSNNIHPDHLDAVPEYPKSSGIVSWHTHPEFIRKQQAKSGWKYPEEAIPSNIDILTSLHASLNYKEPTINIIISNELIGVFYPSKDLLDFLLKKKKTEQNYIIETIIEPNLAVVFGRVSESPTTITTFKSEIRSLIYEGAGYIFEDYTWASHG
jgi:hypothetical protein